MATDLAEFIGAAIGINLLIGLPLFPAALVTGAATFGILALQAYGFRRLEAVIAALVGVIVVAFGLQVFLAEPSPSGIVHGFVPGFEGKESVLLAVGILGATVMPHVIYLHSALTQKRIVGATPEVRKRIFRFELIDVVIAMRHRRADQHEHADHGGRRLPLARARFGRRRPVAGLRRARRVPRLRRQRSCSGSRCSRPGSRRRASARWPARS